MAGDVVYVPILPSLRDFASGLKKGTRGAGRAVGEDIAKDIADGVAKSSAAVDKASEVAAKAHAKVADASGKVRVEEQKLSEVRAKASTASSNLDAAESRLAQLRDSGTASSKQLEAAEKAVETARARSDSAATGIVTAEERLESARRKATTASEGAQKADDALTQSKEKLATAEGDVARATELSADELAKLEKESRKAEQASDDLEMVQGKLAIGFAAAAAAAVGVGVGLVAIGGQFDDMYDTIRIGTGASGEAFEALQQNARNVAAEIPAMEGGMAQIGTTMADLNTRLGATGEPLEKLTSQFLQLQNMGIDADINNVSAALSAFGIDAAAAPAAMDQLFQISQATGLTIDELSTSAVKAGPQLRQFGFDMGESAALIGTLDKAGLDADKTLAGMSKAMVGFAKAGRDPKEALSETVMEIEKFISTGNEVAALDMASELFGTRGAGQFLDAVRSGQMSVEDLMASAGASGDTILGVAAETADWAEQWQIFKQKAMLAVEPLAAALFDTLGPALESAAGIFQSLLGFVGDNETAFTAFAVVIGGMAAGFLVYKAAVTAIDIATRLWAVAQALLNGTFQASGVGLIITLVAGLVAGIVYLATQTQFFQTIWGAVWPTIKAAFSAVWAFLQPAWEAMKVGMQVIGNVAMWLYNAAIKPAWDGIKFAIGLVWDYISFIFDLWKFAFELAGVIAMALWENAIQPAFSFIGSLIQSVWDGVLSPIFGFFGDAMSKVGELATWLYDNAIRPAFDGIKSAISVVWDFVSPILGKIGDAFSTLGDVAKNVGSAIRSAFDGVVGVLKRPINMIGGLLSRIPDKILGVSIPGAGAIKSWGQTLQNLRTGGVIAGRTADGHLYGPGTGTSDSLVGVNAAGAPIVRVSAGEGIVNENAMDNGGSRLVAAMNRGWVPSPAYLAGLPGLADGGTIREPYGLPLGTNTGGFGARSSLFPEWVRNIEDEYGMVASTYAGHQERDGLNKGIDWVGSIPDMQSFAEHLRGIGDQLEQVIWSNPSTGEKIGIADGAMVGPGTSQPGYYSSDWSGHQDHVHTRQSYSFGVAAEPVEPSYQYDDTPGEYGTVSGGDSFGSGPALADGGGSSPSGSGGTSGDPTTVEGIAGKIAGDFVTETAGDFLAIFGLDGITLPGAEQDEPAASTAPDTIAAQPESVQATSTATVSSPPVEDMEVIAEVDPADALSGHDLYAYRIAETAKEMGLPRAGADIGGAAAIVEAGNPLQMWANSKLPESLNLPHDAVGNNGTSTGLFQQQDFAEWGTLAERMDPAASARMFFEKFPAGWEGMDPGKVAQAVQRSSLPNRYAEEMVAGRQLIEATGVYDSGGMLLPGQLAFNASAAREPMAVFNDDQWGTLDDLADPRDSDNPVTVEQVDRQFNQIVAALGGPPTGMPTGDGDLRLDSRPVQITIEVNGADDPTTTARRVYDELEARMASHDGGRTW